MSIANSSHQGVGDPLFQGLTRLTLVPIRVILLSLLCPKPTQDPLLTQDKNKGLPVPYEALWDLPFLPLAPLFCPNHTGPFIVPPQARPTPGHLHILCSLPGMLFP